MRDDPRLEADAAEAGLAVDQLQPEKADEAARGRPAAEALGVGERRAVGLAGHEAEHAGERPRDRAPGVEGAEDVAEADAQEHQAEPGGDEDEGDREVPVGRLGPREAAPDGDGEQADADQAREDLCRRAGDRRRQPARGRAPALVLELRLAPEHRQRDEGDDQDEGGAPGEQPLRDRQVLLADQGMRKYEWERHRKRCASASVGDRYLGDRDDDVLELHLEDPVDRRVELDRRGLARREVGEDVVAVQVDVIGRVG